MNPRAFAEQAGFPDPADAEIALPPKPLRLNFRQPAPSTITNPMATLGWQPKPASDIWTQMEWTNLCQHLHNDNPKTQFVIGFRQPDGSKKYVRSKHKPVAQVISWSWSSIKGKSKSRVAFVPYSTNSHQQSRWGGLDFDAHDGAGDRARQLALAAFQFLLNEPALSVILETSGSGGWHVWAISQEFHDTREWIHLLKRVASLIGAPITAGVCEIFPPDSLPTQFGRGMRAPGCWNPGTDTLSEIVFENTHTSLGLVLSGKSKIRALPPNGLQLHFPDTEKKTSFSSSSLLESAYLQRFAITQPKTRNDMLARLTGHIFHQVGISTAKSLAQAQFQRRTVSTEATEVEHLASFNKLWAGLDTRWRETLSEEESQMLCRLTTDNERDAFRIIRSFAAKATSDRAPDFPIVRDNLARRLGITPNGAAWIRDKLAHMGVLGKTANYAPNNTAARYRWLPEMPLQST